MNYPDFLVYIDCITYNHASYIEDAMNGFCMQETTFPFVAAIIDDASTDGEQNVIKRYLEENFDFSEKAVARKWETDDAYFIYAQHKTNKNCYFAVVLLKYNFWQLKKDKKPLIREWTDNAKYVAFCEGDDYWIDSKKLKKQVDFLEQHTDYSMCFHRAEIKYEDELDTYTKCEYVEDRDYTGNELYEQWIVPTASILARKSIFQFKLKGDNRILNGDIVVVLMSAEHGRIHGCSTVMSIYRVHIGGVTYCQDTRKERYFKYPEHMEFIIDNFSTVNKNKIKKEIGKRLLERSKQRRVFSREWLSDLFMSIKYHPYLTINYCCTKIRYGIYTIKVLIYNIQRSLVQICKKKNSQ